MCFFLVGDGGFVTTGEIASDFSEKNAYNFCKRDHPCGVLPFGGLTTESLSTKKTKHKAWFLSLVGDGGFGPPKSVTTDLQSAPFGRSGNPPYGEPSVLRLILELVIGVEPTTC